MKERLVLAFALAVYAMFSPTPGSAHPLCSDIDAVEDWADTSSDAGSAALDKGQFREAFIFFRNAANARDECGVDIVDTHTQRGITNGNSDPGALRNTWLDNNYGLGAATVYGNAADAAIKLHDRAGCRKMLTLEDAAWRKCAYHDSLNLAKDLRRCE